MYGGRMVDWERAADAFDWDGSLRDLYVLRTGEEAWDRLLGFLRGGPWPVEYSVNDVPAALPERASDVFALREQASPLLRVDPAGLHLNCHFFDPSEIEFDFDPRDANGPAWLARLLAFMGDLAALLRKPVLMTPEDGPGTPWLRVGPDPAEVTWLP